MDCCGHNAHLGISEIDLKCAPVFTSENDRFEFFKNKYLKNGVHYGDVIASNKTEITVKRVSQNKYLNGQIEIFKFSKK